MKAESGLYDGREEVEDEILNRIQEGVKYMRNQWSAGEPVKQTTRFAMSATSRNPALTLLRKYGILINTSKAHEVYELGIPRPQWVAEGMFPGVHDPQWWLGRTAAEIKAGPYAGPDVVKRAGASLKRMETKKSKRKAQTPRKKELAWKLSEGMKRQGRQSKMYGACEVRIEAVQRSALNTPGPMPTSTESNGAEALDES